MPQIKALGVSRCRSDPRDNNWCSLPPFWSFIKFMVHSWICFCKLKSLSLDPLLTRYSRAISPDLLPHQACIANTIKLLLWFEPGSILCTYAHFCNHWTYTCHPQFEKAIHFIERKNSLKIWKQPLKYSISVPSVNSIFQVQMLCLLLCYDLMWVNLSQCIVFIL